MSIIPQEPRLRCRNWKAMKVSQLAVSLMIAACVYLAGTLLFGRYNTESYEELESAVVRLQDNLVDLQHTSDALYGQIDLLRRSRDTVRVAARDLQLYADGESVVRFSSYNPRAGAVSPGSQIRYHLSRPDYRPAIRAAALLAFVVSLLLQVVAGGSARARQSPVEHHRQSEILRASR